MTPTAHLAQLTLLRDIRRRELDVLDARLEQARRTRREVEATWTSGTPRPLIPLVAALVSALASNTALLAGLGIVFAGCREPFINALFTLTTLIALAMMPFGRQHPWLRRLSMLFLALAVSEVVYAAYELEGVGFPIRS